MGPPEEWHFWKFPGTAKEMLTLSKPTIFSGFGTLEEWLN